MYTLSLAMTIELILCCVLFLIVSLGPSVHKHQYNSNAVMDINLDNVCKKGNTLLWDLVQDEDAVSLFYIISLRALTVQTCN